MRRRPLLAGLGAGLLARPALAGGTGPALTLLVGARRGGPTDRWARGFVPFLERHWPRCSVELRNEPGEGGLQAAQQAATASPGARVLALVTTPNLLARAVERGEAGPPADLTLIAAVSEEPVVLVGPPDAELATLRRAGRDGLIATPPPGGAPHIAALAVQARLGLTPIAFPSGPAARQAVIAGHAAAATLSLPHAIGALREGKLSAVALGTDRRYSLLPDTPGFVELGLPKPLRMLRGFAAGADAEGLEPLSGALRSACADPEYVDLARERGFLAAFRDNAAWMASLDRSREELEQRWSESPWTPRQD